MSLHSVSCDIKFSDLNHISFYENRRITVFIPLVFGYIFNIDFWKNGIFSLLYLHPLLSVCHDQYAFFVWLCRCVRLFTSCCQKRLVHLFSITLHSLRKKCCNYECLYAYCSMKLANTSSTVLRLKEIQKKLLIKLKIMAFIFYQTLSYCNEFDFANCVGLNSLLV